MKKMTKHLLVILETQLESNNLENNDLNYLNS